MFKIVFSGTFTGTPTFTAPTSTAGALVTAGHYSRADLSTLKVRRSENYQVESFLYAAFFLPFKSCAADTSFVKCQIGIYQREMRF